MKKDKILTEKQIKRLEILNRKKYILESNKNSVLNTLRPILEDLEKIRLEIDEIELE